MKNLLLILTLGALPALASDPTSTAEQRRFFEIKIRPVLAEHCYRCHSLAEGTTKGGLSLDTREGWQKGGETGPAIIPGNPASSLIIKAIHQGNPDTAMPPKDGKLPANLIADLETWIKMGAPDPRTHPTVSPSIAASGMTESMKTKAANHWAFQPILTPNIPLVQDRTWPANPVDQFVLAQLEEHGLNPSPAADPRTLIRRVYLDLIGLPPTPEEVLAFVRDESPEAFAKVVDALLARPQYGERWGRYWLDVARYADTRGTLRRGESPLDPNAWTYRDYVVQAFNQDKPYDQFVREQIAADQLPSQLGNSSLAALGFLTQGDQFMGNRQDIINDQIDVVTKGFLGLTVTCARCHDHKFDPIPQADYYSLHGIFNSSSEPETKPLVAAPAISSRSQEYEKQREKILQTGREKAAAEMNRFASFFNQHARTFMQLGRLNRQSPPILTLLNEEKIEGRLFVELGKLMAAKMGGRRTVLSNPVLLPLRRLMALKPERFTTDFPSWQTALAKESADGRSNRIVSETFRDAAPKTREEALDLYASLFTRAETAWQVESTAWNKAGGKGFFPGLNDPALEALRIAVVDPNLFRTGPIDENIQALPRALKFLIASVTADLATLDVSHAGAPGRANILADNTKPLNSPIFLRGQIQNPGPIVPRQFLEFLSGPVRQPFTHGSGRLELAEAITSPTNPLTARVLVNRVWQHHFSEGLVSTPDDLGMMSPPPSHPALLDYLASQFIQHGWSIKQLHRAILLSKTWQQSSKPDPAKAKLDPFNRLLWRQNLQRLDFESLRDSLLFMGGQLDFTMGGHPVNIESEPYSQRRSIYGFIDRNEMAEFMRHFDVANAQLPTGRRFTTIVPQQALFRMNSLLVIEQARHIIDRPDVQAATSDLERLRKIYEIIYQRWPQEKEVALATAYLRSQSTLGQAPPLLAKTNTSSNLSKMPPPEQHLDPIVALKKQKQAEREKMNPQRQSAAIKEAVRDPAAETVDRSPLTPWEKYAQALLMTNEMAYVN